MPSVKRVLIRRLQFPTFLNRTERSRVLLFISLLMVGLFIAALSLLPWRFTNRDLLSLLTVTLVLFIFQRYAKNILQEQRDWGLTILDTINEGIITTDEKGKVTFMNPTAELLTGWSAIQAVGKPLDKVFFIRSEKTNRPLITHEHLVAKVVTEPKIAYMYNWRGKVVPIRHHTAPIKNGGGTIIGSIRIFRDITQRVKIEIELEKRKRAFETLVENAGDIITRHDTNYRYIYVNRETERITNKPRKEFIGKTFKDVINNKIAVETLTAGLGYVYSQQKTYTTEYRTMTSEGIRYFHSRFVPEFDRARRLTSVLIISRDITELKLLSERKDEFIAMANHEIKTPLTSIKIFTQLIEKQFHGDETTRKYFTVIQEQVNKLTHFINDMLDVTKIQSGKLELYKKLLSLPELIDKTIMVINAVSPEHTIQVKNTSGVSTLYGDPERIGQVLTNLLTNAVKYSSGPSPIILEVTKDKQFIVISVRDMGIGIAEPDQKKIFERFYRVYQNGEHVPGLGIGLYISYEIVKQHGGSMWVESRLGHGSTFFVKLPLLTKS